MPSPTREPDDETRDRTSDSDDNDQRFSQDDDDTAGRSWHGMNSDSQAVADRVEDEEDDDEDDDDVRAGRILRI